MGKKGKITFFSCGYFLKHLCTSFEAFIVQCILCLKPNLVSAMLSKGNVQRVWVGGRMK